MENRRADDGRIGDIHKWVKGLDKTIHGNGELGLKTKVALNSQSVNRLWIVGGGTVTIVFLVIGFVLAYT